MKKFFNVKKRFKLKSRGPATGFTLVELVVVVALLGILAGVAIPRFISVNEDANQAVLDSLVGTLNRANRTNAIAQRELNGKGVAISGTSNCETASALLLEGGTLPSGYTVTPTTTFANTAIGDDNTCTLVNDALGAGSPQTFTVTVTA